MEFLLDKLTRPGYNSFSRSLSVNAPLRGGEALGPPKIGGGTLEIGERGSLSLSFTGSNGGLFEPLPSASICLSFDKSHSEQGNGIPWPA